MSSGSDTPTIPPNPTPFEFGFRNLDEKMELGKTSNVESVKDEIEDEIEDFTPSEGPPTSISECREIQRLHWKRASRSNHGLMLTSPLRHVHSTNSTLDEISDANVPLLRPQELRLAIMASERLLILQPHNWALRRDHGMMLYYSSWEYGKAIQELSICMAFAPEEEAEVLEPFVEKLHLMRLESSWKSLGHVGRLAVP